VSRRLPGLGRVTSKPDRGPILRHGAEDAVWTLNPLSGVAAHRFDCFVRGLPMQLLAASPQCGLLLCLIAYECVPIKSDLIAIARAAASISTASGHRILWTSKFEGYSHLEARCLSMRTRLVASRLPAEVDWPSALKELGDFLRDGYPESVELKSEQALERVFADAKTWFYLHLPLCLYSHVQGAVKIPFLGDEVLRRLVGTSPQDTSPSTACEAVLSAMQDQSWDDQLDFLSSSIRTAPAIPARAIALIQGLFSVTRNQAGLRLATHLNARESRDKLGLAIEQLRSEGWVAAVLASWATHILTIGSVRKENPAVSTLAGYVSAMLEPLAQALCSRGHPPSFYSQADWEKLFETVRESNSSGQHAAALASVHQWAVQTYGCNPMPEVIFQQIDATQVHANIIWPHELQLALERAAFVSQDERVSNQVQVMLALGGGGLFRVGDLLSLTTYDILDNDDALSVHVNPRRGLHGGKSRAARRVVRIHDPGLIALITQWRERRKLESSFTQEDALLFGDPHTPRKLYRMGQCLRLANELLRTTTGDDRVSFHTLRHASATSRLYALLTQAQSSAGVSPLDELCHEMGHAGRETLWSTYFHLPEFGLRAAIDGIPAVETVGLEEAAFWLETTPAALRQRAHRQTPKTSTAHALYSKWLAEFADSAYPRLQQPTFIGISAIKPAGPESGKKPRPLQWVRQALAVVAMGAEIEAICLRLSCSVEEIRSFCFAVQDELRSMQDRGSTRLPMLSANADIDHTVAWVRVQLATRGWVYGVAAHCLAQELFSYA